MIDGDIFVQDVASHAIANQHIVPCSQTKRNQYIHEITVCLYYSGLFSLEYHRNKTLRTFAVCTNLDGGLSYRQTVNSKKTV